MYVDPNSQAQQQVDAWASSDPTDAAEISNIASEPQGFWFGSWSGDVQSAVSSVVGAAAAAGKVPVLVAYDIPHLDCGSGGASSSTAYESWISSFAAGIGSGRAIVVVEPDALASMSCLSASDQSTRVSLISYAASVLKQHAGASVYLDIGHSGWLSASDAASRLNSAEVGRADGFSLNVSNFDWTSSEVAYGNQVSSLVGGKHFVVDTSRNGLGPDPSGQWCNPSRRALGDAPTLATGQPLADAYLWVKRPGESDGTCNGGPAAGQWWASYALGLAERAAY
jgi:endoglucanase